MGMKFTKLRIFLPSKDYILSKAFYKRLGFKIAWEGDDLSIMKYDHIEFFLQKFYVKLWAENTMVQLFVQDIVEFYAFVEGLKIEFPSIRLKPIQHEDYGTTFHLLDPSGVLLHIMQDEA
jgi:predicted enzyme related to lactoylglutathione lyase